MYFVIGNILLTLVLFLFGCAKKEVPLIGFPPSQNQTLFEKPKDLVKKEQVGVPAELSKVLAPEKEEEKKDLDYWKKYGRGSAPLLAIFFDFDAFDIREDMWERIKKNVQYLLAHPEVKVELQGNCDERGTNEYNMALGSKRALEVKKVLIRLGVNEARISTISFGEERPLCKESNEECWSLNRRVDFVITR